jgi:Na+-transporting NADH:ubiquinone oxidoreductase subunit NqrB
MATDPVSAAQTSTGKYIYGFFSGMLAILFRVLTQHIRRNDVGDFIYECHSAFNRPLCCRSKYQKRRLKG